MSRAQTECKKCGKKFHYCSSCGYYPDNELGCCSSECVQKWLATLPYGEMIEVLVRSLQMGDVPWSFMKDLINTHKIDVACRLVDKILEEL